MVKYDYILNITFFLRAFYFMGILAWGFAFVGFIRLFHSPVFWLVFSIPFFVVATSRILNFVMISFFYKRFSVSDHKEKRKNYFLTLGDDLPSIDIFIPNVGEEISVLRNSYEGIASIQYRGSVSVYCLDDAGREDVRALAREFGFSYVNRPNAGEMKKAGNLLYSYQRTTGDFIVVFDADVRPAPDFLLEALPYTDDDVGIVQTPQYFPMTKDVSEKSLIEWQAGDIQQDFYRLVQPSRDRFSSAICVGTNAIYSRKALEDSGGFAQVDRSEDVFTGLKLNAAGYRIRYIPLILAVGYNPPTVEGFFRQHNRWCSGSVKLAFSQLLWSDKISKVRRLFYFSGCFNYFAISMGAVLSLHIWAIILFFSDSLTVENFVYFLPNVVFQLMLPTTRVYRSIRSFTLPLIGNVQKYTYLYSYWMLMKGSNMGWTATAEGGHNKSNFFQSFLWLVCLFVVINFLAAIYFLVGVVFKQELNLLLYPVVIYFFYSLYANYCLMRVAFKEFVKEEMEYDFNKFSVESINSFYFDQEYVSAADEMYSYSDHLAPADKNINYEKKLEVTI